MRHGGGYQPLSLTDAAIGLAAVTAGVAITATRRIARAPAPLGNAVLHPPLLTEKLHLGRTVDALAGRGREVVTATTVDLERMVAILVPAVVREVLDTLDLNALILERVRPERGDTLGRAAGGHRRRSWDRGETIDGVAKRIDLDAIADRIDLDRIVARLDPRCRRGQRWTRTPSSNGWMSSASPKRSINEIDMPEISRLHRIDGIPGREGCSNAQHRRR